MKLLNQYQLRTNRTRGASHVTEAKREIVKQRRANRSHKPHVDEPKPHRWAAFRPRIFS